MSNTPNGERIAANAALLRLFKNEYRESSDRHSDSLFVRDYVQQLEQDKARLDWLEQYGNKGLFPETSECLPCLKATIVLPRGTAVFPQTKIREAIDAARE